MIKVCPSASTMAPIPDPASDTDKDQDSMDLDLNCSENGDTEGDSRLDSGCKSVHHQENSATKGVEDNQEDDRWEWYDDPCKSP